MTTSSLHRPTLLDESALLRAMAADPYGIAQVVQFSRNKYVELGGDRHEWWSRFLVLLACDFASEPDLDCGINIPFALNLLATAMIQPKQEGGN